MLSIVIANAADRGLEILAIDMVTRIILVKNPSKNEYVSWRFDDHGAFHFGHYFYNMHEAYDDYRERLAKTSMVYRG